MTVESILISKNRDQFNNIINFMRSLIFMNTVDADECETTDSLANYNLYEGAYLGVDSSLSYTYTRQQLIDFGFSETSAETYFADPKAFQTAYMNGSTLCKAFLNSLRKQRIANYTENNPYYRQFCGLPYDEDQYIYVTNTDKSTDDDPDYVLLHKVTSDEYPLTYSRLFYEREVEEIYADHTDYLYLQFLEDPMDPYVIRNKEMFEICYYDDTILSGSEIMYWFEAYNYARNEIMQNDYIEAFEKSYRAYTNVELVFILSLAFNLYCGKMLEKYAVRDFTDSEVIDIIESNGLSELKSLDISLLRKIVNRLPDLKAYTGTEKVIDIIFDIVADASICVKRLYLKKKYSVDLQGNTAISTDGLYNENVELVFQEKTIKRGSLSTDTFDQEYDYDTVTMSDDTWGGTTNVLDTSEKQAIKTAMKKELLAADFSQVMTKYISISKIIDMHVKLLDLSNKLGLLYQYCEAKGNTISSDKIVYNGIETTALSIYAAWCIVFGTLNGLSDPDSIPLDSTLIEGIMKLRTTDKLSADALSVSDLVIDIGKGTFSEDNEITNTYGEDKYLKDIVALRTEAIEAKHPKFSHYSLKKTVLDEIEYQIKSISSYGTGSIDNETVAYDQRTNTKAVTTTTYTDTSGNTKVEQKTITYGINGKNSTSTITVSEDDDFDSENIETTDESTEYTENPDNRKVYIYSSNIAEKLAVSGTSEVIKTGLSPVYIYNEEDCFDGLYAYDGNTLSGYTEKTTYEDTNGNKHIEYKVYTYELTSAIAKLTNSYNTTDEGFDASTAVKTSTTETAANTDLYKIYMYNNGEWVEADNAWVETELVVDSSRNIIVPAGATFDLYAVYYYAKTVGDYLTEDEIKEYLVSFPSISTLTIDSLYANYDENYEILEAIEEKIINSYSYEEYQLWTTIYNANLTYQTLNSLFEGASNYSEYIESVSSEFYDYVTNTLEEASTESALREFASSLQEVYSNYISELSADNAAIYTDDSDIAGGEDLDQVTTLFESFVSLFTQLYSSTYSISYDSEADNDLAFLYSTVKQAYTSSCYDILELHERKTHDVLYSGVKEELELLYYYIDKLYLRIEDSIELQQGKYTLSYDEDGNAVYDFTADVAISDVLKQIVREYLVLDDHIVVDTTYANKQESLSLNCDLVGDKLK